MARAVLLLALLALVAAVQAKDDASFAVQFQWNLVNFTWPSAEAYEKAKKDEGYIEKNNVIAGIKFWRGRMYLSVPRWRKGVPATLTSTSARPVHDVTAPLLEPFPSWDMQKVGDCAAFQFVRGMEVDPAGRMWVLDTGRSAILTLEAQNSCPPRLVILDLENNGTVLRSYPFPADVANPQSAQLNSIVLEHEDGGYAYITDSDEQNPGLIVYSLRNGTSWKVTHDSMRANADAVGFMLEVTRVGHKRHLDGLALSPASTEGSRTLYYTPLSSFNIFAVPTEALKNSSARADIGKYVRVLGRKPSQTDGMIMSNSGVLFFGLLADDAVSLWNSQTSFVTGQRIIARDHHLMQWPESFAFDDQNRLWCVTNRLHAFLADTINLADPNFRAIASNQGMKSYQYYADGRAPELPTITAGASALGNSLELALAGFTSLLLLRLLQ